LTNACICAMLEDEIGEAGMKWIRPVLSVIAMLGITAGFFCGRIETDTYLLIAAGTIAWWFKSRDTDKQVVK